MKVTNPAKSSSKFVLLFGGGLRGDGNTGCGRGHARFFILMLMGSILGGVIVMSSIAIGGGYSHDSTDYWHLLNIRDAVTLTAAETATTSTKYTVFFDQKMCHPGYGPHNSCTERLKVANPYYTEDCPNLDRKDGNTLWPLGDPGDGGGGGGDISSGSDSSVDTTMLTMRDVGGRHGCEPALDTWNKPFICAYLCYSHEQYGVTIVPETIWNAAQEQEGAVWKSIGGNNDRAMEHITAFDMYKDVANKQLGDVIEVGSGPWTQSRFLLKTLPEVESTIKSFTVYEPGANFYIANVRTCAYKNGKTLEAADGKRHFDFPLHIIGTGGESLLTHPKQYDTLVSINVIEHVQNAYSYLTGLHAALKPGGLLIFHDRYFDDPNEGNCVLGVNHYHPIRITRLVLDLFLEHFDEIYRNTQPTPRMIRTGCNEKPIYFIGYKK